MNIQFDKKYRIRTYDSYNLCIEEYKKISVKDKDTKKLTGKSKMEWRVIAYYGKLSDCLNSLLNKVLSNDSASSIKKLQKSLVDFEKNVLKKLDELEVK